MLLPRKRTSLKYPTPIRQLEDFQGVLDDGALFTIFTYDPLPEDVATRETVSVDGPEWSMNDYPSLMQAIGLQPRITCSSCSRGFKIKEGMKTCPFCGDILLAKDAFQRGTAPSYRPLRSIDIEKTKNEVGHGDPVRPDDPHDIKHDSEKIRPSTQR